MASMAWRRVIGRFRIGIGGGDDLPPGLDLGRAVLTNFLFDQPGPSCGCAAFAWATLCGCV
jgi:hypothetical protein